MSQARQAAEWLHVRHAGRELDVCQTVAVDVDRPLYNQDQCRDIFGIMVAITAALRAGNRNYLILDTVDAPDQGHIDYESPRRKFNTRFLVVDPHFFDKPTGPDASYVGVWPNAGEAILGSETAIARRFVDLSGLEGQHFSVKSDSSEPLSVTNLAIDRTTVLYID